MNTHVSTLRHGMLSLVCLLAFVAPSPASAVSSWKPATGPLKTRWAKDVSPSNAHPEYPRPQMKRADWQNLNGLWQYAIGEKDAPRPASWDGEILVPFPVESALSGVMRRVGETKRLWYHRTFKTPQGWRGQRVLLHFGAVDWQATVWINGKKVGTHAGGYDAFSFDITGALTPSGPQEIVVSVFDPTDAGYQPRGKQVRRPHGIWYTPTTGIWQTVWLEPVPQSHIGAVKITPDLDAEVVEVAVAAVAAGARPAVQVKVQVLDAGKVVREGSVAAKIRTLSQPPRVHPRLKLSLPGAKPWTPESPFLYTLRVELLQDGKTVDAVESYFGMRKISLCKDGDGVLRLCLNNKPLFQLGPLDQGFWPDGLYTAPTDEALRYDIEVLKSLGFNMARKHVKIEPARWYYWCDKLGLLVWQDMPSGNFGGRDDKRRSDEASAQYERELRRLLQGFYNHPSIVMWVPFNEGWGQHETARYVDLIKKLDPTRLVNNASGWADRKVGDVHDIHKYPGPAVPPREETRASVLGEFGGLGLPVKGHTWQAEKNWGYRSFQDRGALTEAYLALLEKLHPMTGAPGLAAAVYTQTTDVEIEVNGLMTYDRALVKMDRSAIAAAAKKLYTAPAGREARGDELVPPSTPLVACDPYFSIWSPADALNEAETVHWTGRPHRIASLVRVDGKAYRLMGAAPRRLPALKQTSLEVLPTRTVYGFEGAGLALTLTFLTAALPEDLDLLSRPVTYLTWTFRATDGNRHDVDLYFDASAELCVNEPRQQVVWSRQKVGELAVLEMGSKNQPVLARKGDNVRIDWGYLYVAAPETSVSFQAFSDGAALKRGFAAKGLASAPPPSPQAPASASQVTAALGVPVGTVGSEAVSRWILLAYDDLYSIQYMKKNLRPYWRRSGLDAAGLLQAAAGDYAKLVARCSAFDGELMADLTRAGGTRYARLCALAYRHCFAAGKFVADANGQPLSFCKECFSNGCIGTSDVFYPMSPQFLLFGPTVAKSFLVPFMNYAASPRWKFPFAPHDLGTYPHANGQRYGGGERSEANQMPVEESGNLLILMAAVAEMEGNADFASLYWPQLEKWAKYLRAKGFDPENQLCTDDFAGHLAHNVNLSAKAICGLAAFAKLARMRGETAVAGEYLEAARDSAARWVKEADDGDHFRLAFDRPGTWSQKYNVVWDRILGFNLWPPAALQKEMAYYRKVQNKYGLPLDNRSLYTKLDWVLWTATLTGKRDDFESILNPVYRFLNETPDRVPMTDWYWTNNGRRRGFQARPVVGGVFLRMLYEKDVWKKYAGRDATKASGWAPMPRPPVLVNVVPTAQDAGIPWRYTTRKPSRGWFRPDFDDSSWKKGAAGFGTRGTPGAVVRTVWDTPNVWLRREFTLPPGRRANLHLHIHHDEDARVYINGIEAAAPSGYTTEYEAVQITPAARNALHPGKNVMAIHCRQTNGGQYIDAGLVDVVPAK